MSTQTWNVAIFRNNGAMEDRAMFGDWNISRDIALNAANELNRWCLVNRLSGQYVAYPVPVAA